MKVTEKSLKVRCSELNLGTRKDTTFGIRAERIDSSYTVSLAYRDGTPTLVIAKDISAAEAAAAVEAAAHGAAAVKQAGTTKPEYVTRETFVRQAGERCPKCQTKDISLGHHQISRGTITQACSCQRCSLTWNAIYRLDDYDAGSSITA